MIERRRVNFFLACLFGAAALTLLIFSILFGPLAALVVMGSTLVYIASFAIYIIPLYLLWRISTKKQRRPRRPCPQCDYELLETQTRCPECGHSLTQGPYAHAEPKRDKMSVVP